MTADDNPRPTGLGIAHVLVPLDGSELALKAVPTARVLAERFAAELHSVSVAGDDEDPDRLRSAASAALGAGPGDERAFVVAGGDPAAGIASRARELGSCLVCLSSQGRGRVGGAVIGSVARSVVQHSSEPLVALGPFADNREWSPWPRPEPLSVSRIVACVDGSDTSEQVLPLAVAWARELGMSMTIATVIEPAPPPVRPERRSGLYGIHTDAGAYIDALVQAWSAQLPNVDGQVINDPISPASGIQAHLDQRPAGLVAVTTHARSGIQRVLLGATAASIVRASVAPCLVAPIQP